MNRKTVLTVLSCIWHHNVTTYLDSNDCILEEICLLCAYFVILRVHCIRMEITVHYFDGSNRYIMVMYRRMSEYRSIP